MSTGSTNVGPSVYNDGQTSCTNVLKEVAYTVNVSEVVPSDNDPVSDTAYLRVDSIDALVVVQD